MAIKREYPTIIGGTVCVNQLVDSNTSSVTIPNGHKFYAKINYTETIGTSDGTAISVTGGVDLVTDLTRMFGSSEIADYVYSLEQQTTGAGIAWLKKYGFFTEDYIPYNEGELKSVNVSKHVTVGFNQWDEETETGMYGNGGKTGGSNYLRCKNLIPVIPGQKYFCTRPNGIAVYTYGYSDENYNGSKSVTVPNSPFTIPDGVHFIGFSVSKTAYGSETYKNDICINLSWSGYRNGEYEPYVKHEYPLDSSKEFRGIFKLNNGELYADGDVYESDGTVTRKYGVVDLGTLNWNTTTSPERAFATVPNIKIPSTTSLLANVITENNYMQKSANLTLSEAGQFAILNQNRNIVFYYDGTLPSGHMVYELATPTTETAEPFTSPQICDPDGTEEWVTENGVPVGHETRYQL